MSKGTPLQGDRGAWDSVDFSARHARGIDEATYKHHVPVGTEGQMLYNDAGKWKALSDLYWDDTASQLQVTGAIVPQTTDQDLGSSSLRWDVFANTIDADNTITLTGVTTGTDDTVLLLNASNQVIQDEIDSRVWGTSLVDGTGAASHVAYWTGTGTLSYDSNQLNWDATNDRLGIGSSSPCSEVTIGGSITDAWTGMTIGLTSSSFGVRVGQGNSNYLDVRWFYNAMPGDAIAKIRTCGYSNALYIDGDELALQSQTTGGVAVGSVSAVRKFHATASTSITNVVEYVQRITHTSSGTEAAGFGAGLEWQLSNTTGAPVAAYDEVVWDTVGASYKADRIFKVVDSVATREFLRARATGSAAAIGVFGTTPVAQPSAYTLTNRTDDRAIDCDSTTLAEVADVLATVIYDLQQYGWLA